MPEQEFKNFIKTRSKFSLYKKYSKFLGLSLKCSVEDVSLNAKDDQFDFKSVELVQKIVLFGFKSVQFSLKGVQFDVKIVWFSRNFSR